jgi:cytochrome c-type biogenesis protein CcmF
MSAEIGHFALILAFIVAIFQSIIPLIGAASGNDKWMAAAVPAAKAQFVLTGLSFATLMYAFIVSDFSVRLVTLNSHSLKPMLYKISGTWGNHEGSMLLWVLILTFYGASVAAFGSSLRPSFKARVLAVQSMIAVAFMAFVLFTSNPFEREFFAPFDGQDLNPLLQDPGLAFHPPFLYLGYVGLSMAFSFAVAALIEGRVDAAWARWVRPWTLVAWINLTIGIALGSWWAYYELGWGGWWFWDPVENASFMPWLVATALLHSAIVVEKRESLKSWTILLAILAFSFSLIGTFIVRSGVLTSVHAFATDPTRGVFILAILMLFTGGALSLYAVRAPQMRAKGVFGLVSRETALIANNLLLVVAAFVVFIGTLWPLFAEFAFGQKLSVGAPFFDQAFTPFVVMIALILPIGSALAWKRGDLGRAVKPLWGLVTLSVALGAAVWSLQTGGRLLAPVGVTLATWLVCGAWADLWGRARAKDFSGRLRRLRNMPRADFGKALSHAGLGITIFGISAITAWQVEDIRIAHTGDVYRVGAYEIHFDGVTQGRGKNYSTTTGNFTVFKGGNEVAKLHPEKRFYPVARMPTTEAAIDQGFTRDVYLVIGDPQEDGGWAVRAYIKPFANWIWAGALIMALGGAFSVSDRRFRVAGGARSRTTNTVAAE